MHRRDSPSDYFPDGTVKPWVQRDRGAKFNEKHSLKYGLAICSRNNRTNAVESVMCKFCVAFGKESSTSTTRKRRATANIKYFRIPFRSDHYLSHLEINHKEHWKEYESLPQVEKEQYFTSYADANISATTSAMTGTTYNLMTASGSSLHSSFTNTIDHKRAKTNKNSPLKPPLSVNITSTNRPSQVSEDIQSIQHIPINNQEPTSPTSHLRLDEDHENESTHSHVDDDREQLDYNTITPVRLPALEIEKDIVDGIIGDMFYNQMDEVDYNRSNKYQRDLNDPTATKSHIRGIFAPKTNSSFLNGSYTIAIKNQRLFDLAIKFVSCGASYRLASRMLHCTFNETKLRCYRGCSEKKIAGYIRAVLASNMQKIALMMRASWAYSIATDAAVHQYTSYLDIRIRLWQNGAIQDFHLMTLPTFDQYPAPSIIQRIEQCLEILDSNWRNKLLGTSTHGGIHTGRNTGMTGSQQGLAARLTGLVTKPGFYLIWCAIHQLELVVKNCITSFCDKSFYNELIALMGCLKTDRLLGSTVSNHNSSATPSFQPQDIPDLTHAYTSTRGFAQCTLQVFKWLIEHREPLGKFFSSLSPEVPQPSPSWWVCVTVAHRMLAEVEYFIKKLIGMENGPNLASDQVQELCKLALIMADVVGARRDLLDTQDINEPCATAGSFLLTHQNAQQFILNEGGPLAIDMFDTLRGVERLHLSKSVATFAVNLISGVAAIAQEGRHYCVDHIGVLVNPPKVLPYDVYVMGKQSFLTVLSEQVERLRETISNEQIVQIENDYDAFFNAVETEPILHGILKRQERKTDVSFAWSCLNGRFQALQSFVGSLATTVPEVTAASLSADLTWLNWDKPDYRQTMVDFALEGILHAKQKTKIELVDIQQSVNTISKGVNSNLQLRLDQNSAYKPIQHPDLLLPGSSLPPATEHDLDLACGPTQGGEKSQTSQPLGLADIHASNFTGENPSANGASSHNALLRLVNMPLLLDEGNHENQDENGTVKALET